MSIKVHLSVVQSELNQFAGRDWILTLREGSSIIDAIKAADELISRRTAVFPVKGFRSLLQMTYHPIEERFYRQVAVQAYERPGVLIPVRQNPKMPLPDGAFIILIPEGPCIAEWEDVMV